MAIVGALILCAVIFHAGTVIGFRKATFSYRLGDNYHRIFVGRSRSEPELSSGSLSPSHGVSGKIVKVDLPELVIESYGNTERSVIVNDRTEVRKFREALKPQDLRVDDEVVVIGSPDDSGEMEARLIRLIPADIRK